MLLVYVMALVLASLGCSRKSEPARVTGETLNATPERKFVHDAHVWSVAFSPDGQLLATSSVDKTVKFWRVTDGALVRTLVHPEGVTCIAFSPDGRTLATASYDKLVRLWRVSDGALQKNIAWTFRCGMERCLQPGWEMAR